MADRAAVVVQRSADPVHRPARDDLDLGPLVAEYGGRLERALTSAHDSDPAAPEDREIHVVPGMAGEMARQIARELRDMGELADAHRHHHRVRHEHASIGDLDSKAVAALAQLRDQCVIDLRHRSVLEPHGVVDEEVEGDRLSRPDPFDLAVRVEAVGALGGSQAGSAPDGFQEHAGGHLPPGIHRLAENVHRHAVPAKVRGDRQAVWAGADDGGRCGGLHARRHRCATTTLGC